MELAAATLAGPLRQAADDLLALREAWRGLSQVERDIRLGVAADYLRDVEHLAREAKTLLRAFTGFRTPRELAVVTQPKGEAMNKLDALSVPLISAGQIVMANETFGPVWSKVIAGALSLLGFLVARKTPVAPKVQP